MPSQSPADDKQCSTASLPPTLLFVVADSLLNSEEGLDPQADRVTDTVLLQGVVLDVALLLLLFVRDCRRGVTFFLLSRVILCHDSLENKNDTCLALRQLLQNVSSA